MQLHDGAIRRRAAVETDLLTNSLCCTRSVFVGFPCDDEGHHCNLECISRTIGDRETLRDGRQRHLVNKFRRRKAVEEDSITHLAGDSRHCRAYRSNEDTRVSTVQRWRREERSHQRVLVKLPAIIQFFFSAP
ncbi:unannotated protein [freshwater metagenome]|uniref:Unannotated protein n=1 Tax=freshwater metagenome TaxID=449393 RepID=A0A6J7IHN9_9ZZZZ